MVTLWMLIPLQRPEILPHARFRVPAPVQTGRLSRYTDSRPGRR
jgi:hypothetical protein